MRAATVSKIGVVTAKKVNVYIETDNGFALAARLPVRGSAKCARSCQLTSFINLQLSF
jgi:hypothetical protein